MRYLHACFHRTVGWGPKGVWIGCNLPISTNFKAKDGIKILKIQQTVSWIRPGRWGGPLDFNGRLRGGRPEWNDDYEKWQGRKLRRKQSAALIGTRGLVPHSPEVVTWRGEKIEDCAIFVSYVLSIIRCSKKSIQEAKVELNCLSLFSNTSQLSFPSKIGKKSSPWTNKV